MLYVNVQTSLDALNHHLADLRAEGAIWPETLQECLQSFSKHLHDLTHLVSLKQLPILESRTALDGVWFALQTLELVQPSAEIAWQLDLLRKILIAVSDTIHQHILYQMDSSLGKSFPLNINTPLFAAVS